MKRRIIRVKNDLYPFTVVLVLGAEPADTETGRIARRCKLWNGEGRLPSLRGGRASTCSFGSGSMMWIKALPSDRIEFTTSYAHELIHVLNNLSETIGEQQTFKHDELFAYFAGWLTRELFSRIPATRRSR